MSKRIIKTFSNILASVVLFTNIAPFAALNNEKAPVNPIIEKSNPPITMKYKPVSNKDTKSNDQNVRVKNGINLAANALLLLPACFMLKVSFDVMMEPLEQRPPDPRILEITKTYADGLTEEQVTEQLHKEIDKYKDRATDVFEIEEHLIKNSHPKTLLLTLRELNRLFDKYSRFTDALIKYKREQGGKFTLSLINAKYYPAVLLYSKEGRYELDLSGIAFGNSLRSYEANRCEYYNVHKGTTSYNGYSDCDNDKLIEYMAAYRFGHVMELLYITLKEKIDLKSCKKLRGRYSLGLILDNVFKKETVEDLLKMNARFIMRDIYKISHGDWVASGIFIFADDVYSNEAFAAIFANSECSKQINPSVQALQTYIKNWFQQ